MSEDPLAPARGIMWGCTIAAGIYAFAAGLVVVLVVWL